MHRAFAPVADRLDEGARAALVTRLQILIRAKIALPLHQAEAARVVIDESADLKIGGIVERTPDLLALPILDRETVAVMDRGAEIVHADAVVGREEIHAGERRKPDLFDLHARKQRRLDVVDRGLAWPDRETIRRGCALAAEQRMHDDRLSAPGRAPDPEGTEVGKFLALGIGGVERKSAGREPIGEVLGHGPEIARTKKHADLVEIVRPVDRPMDAEAGETKIAGVLQVRRLVPEREHVRRIDDRKRLPVLHLEQVHAVHVVEAAMEELQLKREALAAPERLIRLEADHAVAIIG